MEKLRQWINKAPRLKKLIKAAIRPDQVVLPTIQSRFAEMAAQSRCRTALLNLMDEVAALNTRNASIEIPVAFGNAEAVLQEAYARSPRVSIKRIRGLGKIRRQLRSNVLLVQYASDRYLNINKSDTFADHFEKSASARRLANDLLCLLVAADVSVPVDVRAEILNVVALVRDRLSRDPYPEGYVLIARWAVIVARTMRLVSHIDDPRLIAEVSMTFFDLEMPILTKSAIEEMSKRRKDLYLTRFPELQDVGDSSIMRPGTTAIIDGVHYSPKAEQAFLYYAEIFSALPRAEALGTVVEVGSGYGRFARIMRLTGKAKCYVLADLPESLLFAYAFLRVNFPKAKTRFITSREDIRPDMAESFDFIFCPIQQLCHLKLNGVDLLLNTYSFAEMPQPCVDYILDCVHEKIRPRFFYSLNAIFCDKTIHFDTGGLDNESNEIVLKMRPVWKPLRFELLPRLIADKWRIEGSVVLERVPGASPDSLVQEMLSAANSTDDSFSMRLGRLYLAALWSRDRSIVDRFFEKLRRLHITQDFAGRPEYSFENIGEVKFLRRLVGTETP